MKQTKYLLTLSLFLILQACNQNEEILELNTENPQNKIGKTALQDDEQAAFLINQLQNVTSNGRFSGATETAFDSAIFHLDAESGFKNYAFLLSGDNVEQISNLVFIQTDTAFIGYETIYEPTTEHLANLQAGNSIMLNFTGTMSYRSIQTGEVFLEVHYENGIPLPPETASNGRLPLSDGCYPDEAGRIECYTVYVTTNNDGSYTSSTTGINYNNHTFDEPDSPHTDVYNSCMVIDADFSTCYHTFFNTNGMTSYPQYYAGSSQGTLASTSLGPVYEPVNLLSFFRTQMELKIQEDPFVLLDAECNQIENWKNLATHTPPQTVLDKIEDLQENHDGPLGDWDIQYLQDANGTVVNMDYWPVKVSTLPNKPDGNQYTANEFLEFFRKNINDFISGEPFEPYCEIPDLCTQETNLWNSSNPTGALIKIDINGIFGTNAGGNDGVVLCSESKSNFWRFMTLEAPYDWSHPVSGTREFGFTQNSTDGSYEFYTRGVDRLTSNAQENVGFMLTFFSEFGDADPFAPADDFWSSLQSGVKNFIETNGGAANTLNVVKNRPDWEDVKDVLNGVKPITDLGCK